MTTPDRLLTQARDSFELSALRSASSDRGSEAALERALSALSSAVPLSSATTTALAKGSNALLAFKAASVGMALGVCAIGATLALPHSAEPKRVAASATLPTARREALIQVGPRNEPRVPAQEPSAPRAPVLTPTPVDPGPASLRGTRAMAPPARAGSESVASAPLAKLQWSPSATGAPAALGPQLAREVALLDAARRQLTAGDFRGALALLEQRESEIRTPMLNPEATLVRVEALLRAGQTARARALAATFLEHHPRGPHAERLEHLFAQQTP